MLFMGIISAQRAFPIKHRFELSFPTYYFFDKNPMVINYFNRNNSEKNQGFALGVSYGVVFAQKSEIKLSADFVGIHYGEPCRQCRAPGDIFSREAYHFRAKYYYTIISKNYELKLLVAGMFRLGDEDMVVGYPRWFEISGVNHGMRDVGISAGARISKQVSKRFEFSLENSYTYFIYRWDKGDDALGLDFKLGSTKFLMNLNLSVGYYFNIQEAKEPSYVQ